MTLELLSWQDQTLLALYGETDVMEIPFKQVNFIRTGVEDVFLPSDLEDLGEDLNRNPLS